MSDSDDWEAAIDQDEAVKKTNEEGKFEDEDAVDSDDERKKEAEAKAAQRKA